jgi:hypothetical protein
MNYPDRSITTGEHDSSIVKYIQNQLNQIGFGPLVEDGIFGPKTSNSVKAYQLYYIYRDIDPSLIEEVGKVDQLTWESLTYAIFCLKDRPPLIKETLRIAHNEIGVKEVPPGSNSGPRVDEYLKSVRLGGGYPWCAGFVYWSFEQASVKLFRVNPLPRTGSCMDHWNKTNGGKITFQQVLTNPKLIKPGDIFIISRKGGKGHTGIIYDIYGDTLVTVEGNSNAFHSAEGEGVVQLKRKIKTINVGFIRYT